MAIDTKAKRFSVLRVMGAPILPIADGVIGDLERQQLLGLYVGIAFHEDNPMEQVYQAIWTILEASSDFTDLVPTRNRLKHSGGIRRPGKDSAITSDYPWVRVLSEGGYVHMYRTSDGTSLRKRFRIEIATGEQNTSRLFAVEWAILRAMMDWKTSLSSLTWNSKTYVVDCELLDHADTLDDSRSNKGIKGWVCVWVGEVEMWFTSSDLIPA